MLSEEQIKANDKIPTEEIEQDIEDTQNEIDQYENELSALYHDRVGNRLEIYLREGKISRRKGFISDLKQILEYRLNNSNG